MRQEELHELIELYTSAMNEVNRRVNVIMNEKVHQELTTDQFATLRFLQKQEASTSSAISHEFSVGKSAVTAQVNRLFEKGLITRKRDKEDRRIVYLSLTDQGEKLVQQATERLYEVLGDILLEFNQDEIETFIRTLEKLVQILRKQN